jgi:cell division septation protein DedD
VSVIFGNKTNPDAVFNSSEKKSGLSVSPVVGVIIVALVCGCMVGAYMLGFKAGHTNGLELALANSLAQVVRSPIARTDDRIINQNDDSDVYAKLREPAAIKETSAAANTEVSKEVKEFLQPTPTISEKALSEKAAQDKKLEIEAQEVKSVTSPQSEKKNADMAAIERALNEAKQEEPGKKVDDPSVRVIGSNNRNADQSEQLQENLEAGLPSKPEQEVEDFREPETFSPDKSKSKLETASLTKNAKKAEEAESKNSTKDRKAQEKPASTLEKTGPALTSGWYSQVAAPRSLNEAQSIASKLKSAGFKAKIETAQVRDEKYYRVVVGPEANRQAADKTLILLKKQNAVKAEPFIRMVR